MSVRKLLKPMLMGFISTSILFPSYSNAEEVKAKSSLNDDWHVSIGFGVGMGPEFEGADDYSFAPLPMVDIVWKERVYFNNEDGLGVYFYNGDNLQLSGGIGYDAGRDQDDNNELRGLGDVDGSATFKLAAEYDLKFVKPYVNLEQALGGSDGLKATFGVHSMVPFAALTGGSASNMSEKEMALAPALMFGLSAEWVDDNYAESYFGVNTGQSGRSGLSVYNAEAGFKSIDFDIGILYPLNENWALNGLVGYSQLVGDAADSPIVKDDGQFFGGLFVTYTF